VQTMPVSYPAGRPCPRVCALRSRVRSRSAAPGGAGRRRGGAGPGIGVRGADASGSSAVEVGDPHRGPARELGSGAGQRAARRVYSRGRRYERCPGGRRSTTRV